VTGATHARELITVQMVFFSLISLLNGIVNKNPEVTKMAQQNKYYFIPVIN
jgi:murein tripeptide amidase MpaA